MILRVATADDWQAVRELRLEALQTEPGVFGSNYARESVFDETRWREWIAGPGRCVFLLFDGENSVGLTGVITSSDDPTTAICVASYLMPAYRGKHLSRLFYQARIAWARNQGFRRITVGHRLSNLASQRANQAFGFRETERAPYTWPDGSEEPEVCYELLL